jgi:hypothetical protein
MAGRKKRRRRTRSEFLTEDPCDGLEVNNINPARYISKKHYSFTMFDADNVCIRLDDKTGGRRYRCVSIMAKVRKVNVNKTFKINGYKERIKGG